METDADRLAKFLINHTPTISKSESSVSLDFGSPMEADDFLYMLGEMIEDAYDARKAKAEIEAGEKPIPWDDVEAEFGLRRDGEPIDCSDIPEITELGPRLERDAEGRLVVEFDATQALAARRVRAEETRQALQDEINRGMRSTSG